MTWNVRSCSTLSTSRECSRAVRLAVCTNFTTDTKRTASTRNMECRVQLRMCRSWYDSRTCLIFQSLNTLARRALNPPRRFNSGDVFVIEPSILGWIVSWISLLLDMWFPPCDPRQPTNEGSYSNATKAVLHKCIDRSPLGPHLRTRKRCGCWNVSSHRSMDKAKRSKLLFFHL